MLGPGDVLVAPAGWWLAHVSLEPSVAVARNFVTPGATLMAFTDALEAAERSAAAAAASAAPASQSASPPTPTAGPAASQRAAAAPAATASPARAVGALPFAAAPATSVAGVDLSQFEEKPEPQDDPAVDIYTVRSLAAGGESLPLRRRIFQQTCGDAFLHSSLKSAAGQERMIWPLQILLAPHIQPRAPPPLAAAPQRVARHKELGNALFKAGQFREATDAFTKARAAHRLAGRGRAPQQPAPAPAESRRGGESNAMRRRLHLCRE